MRSILLFELIAVSRVGSERGAHHRSKSVGAPPSALRRATKASSSSRMAGSIGGSSIGGEPLLVEPVRRVVGRRRARLAPGLVVAPVGDHRRVEGGAVARLGVRAAEEMAAGADLAHGVERQLVVVDHDGGAGTRPPCAAGRRRARSSRTRQCSPPSIQPAPCMTRLHAAHDRAPQREHALIGRLRIDACWRRWRWRSGRAGRSAAPAGRRRRRPSCIRACRRPARRTSCRRWR